MLHLYRNKATEKRLERLYLPGVYYLSYEWKASQKPIVYDIKRFGDLPDKIIVEGHDKVLHYVNRQTDTFLQLEEGKVGVYIFHLWMGCTCSIGRAKKYIGLVPLQLLNHPNYP